MRKLLVGLLAAGALVMAVPQAQAAPTTLGSFVSATIRAGQPHRLYVVVTAGHGAKTCDVTLRKRSIPVDLGTDKTGSGTFFFLFKRATLTAQRQANSAPSPTPRIVCSH